MRDICIVLTSPTSLFKDVEAAEKEEITETQQDMTTIRETLNDYDIIEIMIDPKKTSHFAEQAVIQSLSSHVLQNASSCHIIVNSHGNIVKKDVQDAAVIKTIQRVSEHNIPVSQLTLLVCYAMAKENLKEARERLIQKRGLNADYVENVRTKDSISQVLIGKIEKMKLPMSQNFEVWGPVSAYNPFEEQGLVSATLRQQAYFDEEGSLRNQSKRITINQLSLGDFKLKVLEAIDWLKDSSNVPQGKLYDKHVTLLGEILGTLFSKLEEKYKSSDTTTSEADSCHFLHQELQAYAAHKGIDMTNPAILRNVYKSWKKEIKDNPEKRFLVFRNYIELDDTLLLKSLPLRISNFIASSHQDKTSALTETSMFRKTSVAEDATVEEKIKNPGLEKT